MRLHWVGLGDKITEERGPGHLLRHCGVDPGHFLRHVGQVSPISVKSLFPVPSYTVHFTGKSPGPGPGRSGVLGPAPQSTLLRGGLSSPPLAHMSDCLFPRVWTREHLHSPLSYNPKLLSCGLGWLRCVPSTSPLSRSCRSSFTIWPREELFLPGAGAALSPEALLLQWLVVVEAKVWAQGARCPGALLPGPRLRSQETSTPEPA